MDPADKDILIENRPELVENIDITNGLFNHLISRKVLNSRMVQTITYNNPPDKQIEELLTLLPRRGPNAFKLFCESLIATDQEDVITNFLQRKDGTLSSSTASSASHSVLSSPLPVSVTESPAVSLHVPVPSASSSSIPAKSSSPAKSPALVESSHSASTSLPGSTDVLLPSDSSCILPFDAVSLPTTPQKRRPVKNSPQQNEEKSQLTSPSETDSSPLKRIRSDSVICIRGENDNVIKIYSPAPGGAGDQSYSRDNTVLRSTAVPENAVASIPRFVPLNKSSQGASQKEEIRYVMKHFITTDSSEDRAREENLRLASSMLSNLPEQYLKLLSANQGLPSKMRGESDFSSDIMRERLSRCDSTDTMETRRPDGLSKPAELDQPDRVTVKVPSPAVTLTPVPQQVKPQDYTDGPLCVQVEECSRQFYNLNKDKAYRMVGMPRGEALIINVNEVSEKPPRRGTDIDRDNLHHLFSQLHFRVTIYNDEDDLTALGMAEKLRAFAAKPEHMNADACVICLLSHGEEGYMFGTDGKKIPLEEIFLLFDNRHCPALLNKPKIFFIQACRGGMLDHGVKVLYDEPDGGTQALNNNAVQHPSMSDMLICYPTLQGYYAWRNRERGSWYIESVVKMFMKHAKCEDICAMLNRVNSDVSRKVSRTPQSEMDRMSQMSEYKSSLRQPYLFFFPGIGTPSME